MDKESICDLLNKVIIAQGESQRVIIWLSRFYEDLEKLKRELIAERDE